MRARIPLILLIALFLGNCKKDPKCPSGTDIGCGCYNTGNPSEPGTSNGWTPVYWRKPANECYWVNTIGNETIVDSKNCTCK